ncbi:MAG: O-antigen ligase family protein [Proteobacteria bacterium]|nr:O-antigen ligase family protein [Pseudomonadota bacterium]
MTLALRRPTIHTEAVLLATGGLLAALVLCVLLSSASTALIAVAFGAMGFGALAILTRQVRRPLLVMLVFTAPIEINKAVVAPLVSRYYPAGPYYSPGLYVSLAHMVLLALAAAWLGRRCLLERRWPPMTRLDWLVLAYAVFIWLRSVGSPQGVLSLASAASYSLALLAFYVASHTIRTASDVRLVLRASVAVLLLTVAYAAAQVVTKSQLELPGIKPMAAGGTVDLGGSGVFRPPGFMGHPNALAHYLVIVLPPAMALVLVGPRRLPARVWWTAFLVAGAAGAALLATLSRGGWVAAALASLVVVTVYYRRGIITPQQLRLLLGATVLCAVATVIVYPNLLLRLTAPDARSLESRILLADMAWSIIKDNAWIGVGFGDYNRAAYGYSPPLFATVTSDYQLALHQLVVHNHYLLLAAELGVPVTAFFAYLLWRVARLPWPLEDWRDPESFALAVGLSAAIVGQALFFNSDNYYADIRVFLFWTCAGVLQAISLQAKNRKVRE